MNQQTTGMPSGRVSSIDIARFIGISLVFYGHLVEQVMYLENAAAAAQYKWVYSFHMPLFFLLAGTVVSSRITQNTLTGFLWTRWTTRMVPYLFFALGLGVVAMFVPGWLPMTVPTNPPALAEPGFYPSGFVSTLMGMPAFHVPFWFLASLISLEVFHYFVGRLWTSKLRLAIGAVVFYLIGYYLNLYVDFFSRGWVFWLVNLIPLGYAFYLTGMLVRRTGILDRSYPRWQLALVVLACIAGVFLTYDLNQGPWRLGLEAVVIVAGAPGDLIWFPITALTGITMVIAVAKLLPQWRFLQYLGEITLLIYGLHGIFYHFVNMPLAKSVMPHLPDHGWSVFLFTTAGTAVSVAICIPVALFIAQYMPLVAGRAPAPRTALKAAT